MLSQELVDAMDTKFARLAEILAPVSMVLMNTYDNEYLGIKAQQGCGDGCDSYNWTLGAGQRGAAAADAFGAAPAPGKGEDDGQG